MTTAAASMHAPATHSPAFSLPVRSLSPPVMYGAANPLMLPSELISAMPPAAAAPVRNRDGSDQMFGSA